MAPFLRALELHLVVAGTHTAEMRKITLTLRQPAFLFPLRFYNPGKSPIPSHFAIAGWANGPTRVLLALLLFGHRFLISGVHFIMSQKSGAPLR